MKFQGCVHFVVLAFACTGHLVHAQSTAFSYQGGLSDEDGPATGLFDLSFGLFTTDTGGIAVSTVTNSSVGVVDGLFTTALDFGAAVFDGTDYWLEIEVQADGGGGFTTLSPRQPLNTVPYSVHSKSAEDLINPKFLGTTTPDPLELFVFEMRGFRLEAVPIFDTVNLIGGSPFNAVEIGVSGATIAGGGGYLNLDAINGLPNIITGDFSTIGGGLGNLIHSRESVIAGGHGNLVASNAPQSTISGGEVNTIQIHAGMSTISGGSDNNIGSGAQFLSESVIMGATIGGGVGNAIGDHSFHCTISGGHQNTIGTDSRRATIGGGLLNVITNCPYATIGGGAFNLIRDSYEFGNDGWHGSTIGGGLHNEIGSGFIYRGGDGPEMYSSIGGGYGNIIDDFATFATISGGFQNTIGTDATGATIGGGISNTASNLYSTVSGGSYNHALGYGSVVAGGGGLAEDDEEAPNKAHGRWSAVGGGALNTAIGDESTVAGGTYNVARGEGATIPGGFGNYAEGDYSFAAGWTAQANHEGSFVWADNSPFFMSSSTNKEFTVRATGGVRFITGIDTMGNPTSGVSVPAGGTGWDVISDRNMKENLEPVNGKEVLEQVAAMPISRWNMKSQPDHIRHIGPMAQDFHAAFGLGESDRRINTVDADGVALAAIQGLNQKLEEKEARIEALEATVAELKEMVSLLAKSNGQTP